MSIVPDKLYHMGGIPVGGGNPYFGMWGNKVYFVDYDNGSKGGPGDEMDRAFKYPADAIAAADKNDVIYFRPRDPNYLNYDPNYILPEGTTNDTIGKLKHGMALVGTGQGRGQGSQFYTYWRGTATGTATPTLNIQAPWTLIENLSFHDGASTLGVCVKLDGQQSGAEDGYACGNTVSNCMFRFSGADALWLESVMWGTVLDCTFHKGAGITISSSEQAPDGIEIGRNQFLTKTAAEVTTDIAITEADMINIHHNIFAHDTPTAGSARYIFAASASTGICAMNYFGTATLAIGTITTLNGIIESGNQGSKGPMTS